ncbi:Serine/threonine-protein phosphatase with EF-hands pef-1 [Diplonema papillatum]|nr:Serine/threonine-protein phosphatase with EF-hands pef-1 [Diplonema papillatum]
MGQCCHGGSGNDADEPADVKKIDVDSPRAIRQSPDHASSPRKLPTLRGLKYEEFADLVLAQYASGEVQTPNTKHEDPRDAWAYTAKQLDHAKYGIVTWEDIEKTLADLTTDWDQSSALEEIIETLTRARLQLRHVFAALDVAKRGQLSRQEFYHGIALLQGTKEYVDVTQARMLCDVFDADTDGNISYREFVRGLSVEDTWGLHPSSNAIYRRKSRRSIHKSSLGNSSCLQEQSRVRGSSISHLAATKLQRFFMRARARRLFQKKVWQVTLHALDLQGEKDINLEADADSIPDSIDTDRDDTDEVPAVIEEPVDDIVPFDLAEVIQALRSRELPPRQVAARIIIEAAKFHRRCPNVGHVSIREGEKLIIVGDLHGQLDDVLLILDEAGLPGPHTTFLFNGDFVDRGPCGVEVLLLLYSLKLKWPDRVFLNRGNHETRRLNEKYGFDEEVSRKYDIGLFKTITMSFCMLPLAHIVENHFFVVHGGISIEEDVTIDDYNMIERFHQIPRKDEGKKGPEGRHLRIFEGAVWSDPREIEQWEESKRGAGIHFGRSLTSDFLQKNGLKKLIRSHEAFQPGYAEHHNRLTLTVFSASNYCGADDNQGCYLVISPTLEMQYRQYRSSGDPRLLRDKVHAAANTDNRATTATVSAEEDALQRIRNLLFCKRSVLMNAFQAYDTEKTGKIHAEEWVAVMRACINEEVPWRCIRSELTPLERDDRIAYVPFLQRFQNMLQQRWSDAWTSKMVIHLAPRMSQFVESLSQPSEQLVSYYEMCDTLRKFVPGLSDPALYHMVAAMDTNKDGFIDVTEFAQAFEAEGRSNKSCMIELWEMSTFDQASFNLLRRGFQKIATRKTDFPVSSPLDPPSRIPPWNF